MASDGDGAGAFVSLRQDFNVGRDACNPDDESYLSYKGPLNRWPAGIKALRNVDWRNLEYIWSQDGWVPLKNGEWQHELCDGHLESMSLLQVSFGDLTGDTTEEAVLVRQANGGGSSSGTYQMIDVVTLESGQPVVADRIEPGEKDFCARPVRRVRVKESRVLLCLGEGRYYESDPACRTTLLQSWRWNQQLGKMNKITEALGKCGPRA